MRLIDADAFIKKNAEIIDCEIDHPKYQDTLRELIDEAPTVEELMSEDEAIKEAYQQGYTDGWKERYGEPNRPHGEWIRHIDDLFPEESTEECSVCHEEQRITGNDDNFCPNCGADMRKRGEAE